MRALTIIKNLQFIAKVGLAAGLCLLPCVALPQANMWTCVSGNGFEESTSAPIPPLQTASTWKDNNGNLWLFGGLTAEGTMHDLWRYTPSNGQWTRLKGSGNADQEGGYGDIGVPADANNPGTRTGAISWTDNSGNLWLFGGSNFRTFYLFHNDLWKYDPTTNQWTWMKGSNGTNAFGTYGTIGQSNVANTPGARSNAAAWTDNSGNLWLFGGYGYAATGHYGYLNDLWKYSPTTNQWTWVHGGNTLDQSGTYGSQGVYNAANKPGARSGSTAMKDGNGNLWLFGGGGRAASGGNGYLNDLWKFNVSSNQWAWVKGSNSINPIGSYGVQGTASAGNTPGARQYLASWADSGGNLWIFGGYGSDGNSSNVYLNDLWKYDVSGNQWTWMKGSSTGNQNGSYSSVGSPAASNNPGGRQSLMGWGDGGTFWLMGGSGYSKSGVLGRMNDFWKYSITGNSSVAWDEAGRY